MRRLLLLVLLLLSPALLAAVETAPRISDREIIEGLAEIKGDIKRLDAEIKAIRVEPRTEIRGGAPSSALSSSAGTSNLIGFGT